MWSLPREVASFLYKINKLISGSIDNIFQSQNHTAKITGKETLIASPDRKRISRRQRAAYLFPGIMLCILLLTRVSSYGVEPEEVSDNKIGFSPYRYTGLVYNKTHNVQGSGVVAIDPRLVLGCAHVVFSDHSLEWANDIQWFHRWHAPQLPSDDGIVLRGSFPTGSYAEMYEKNVEEYGISSKQTFAHDFSVYWAYEYTANGSAADWYENGAAAMKSGRKVLLSGYPSGKSGQHYMHQTGPWEPRDNLPDRRFSVEHENYMSVPRVSAYRGSSGGPVWVESGTSQWHVAGVLVSGKSNTMPYRHYEVGVLAFTTEELQIIEQVNATPIAPVPDYRLNVRSPGITGTDIDSATGHGGVTPYSGNVRKKEKVSLIAPETIGTDAERQRFVGWEGDIAASTPFISFEMNGDKNIAAYYDPDPVIFMVSYEAETGGIIHGDTRQSIIHGRETSPVTAVPDEGFRFLGWSDGVTSTTRSDKNVKDDIHAMARFMPLIQNELTTLIDESKDNIMDIAPGYYSAAIPVVIETDGLSLRSTSGSRDIFLDAGGQNSAMIIEADNVTIDGFCFENYRQEGIVVRGKNIKISNNSFDGQSGFHGGKEAIGVLVDAAKNVMVSDNTIMNHEIGILVRSSAGRPEFQTIRSYATTREL